MHQYSAVYDSVYNFVYSNGWDGVGPYNVHYNVHYHVTQPIAKVYHEVIHRLSESSKVIHSKATIMPELCTGYQSYIRVTTVDKYYYQCGQKLPRG